MMLRTSPRVHLQIFVHRSIVDNYAYPSKAMGIPIHGNITDYVEGTDRADGQARVFMHPEVLVDPERVRLYHYCSRPSQANMDPFVRGSRGALVRELRDLLAPFLDTVEKREGARRRIEGRETGN